MSMDPNAPYQPSGEAGGAPQQKGGSKLLLGLGIGCGLMLLLCCGGGVAAVLLFRNSMKVETAPAQVAAAAQNVTDIDVPAGFEPKAAVSINVPFVNKKFMTMVQFKGPNGKGTLVVADFGEEFVSPEQMRLQMQQTMNQQQQGQEAERLQMHGEAQEVNVTIRGEESVFTIQRGEAENGDEYVQVEGAFKGKEGPAMLFGQLPASDYSEEDAEALVKSLK